MTAAVTRSARITVRPGGHVFEAGPDESIMAAAQRAGFRWPTVCGGAATCRTCVFTLHDGGEHLTEPSRTEAEALALVRRPRARSTEVVRLACQARTSGDLTITKPGVRPDPGSRR